MGKIQPRIFDKQKVKNNFAQASPFYDYWAGATESKAAKRVLELTDFNGKKAILEVAVGTGLLFEKLLIHNHKGYTAGVDLSPDMIRRVRERVKRLSDIGAYSLQQASAYRLPFADEIFDCLISCYMLDLLPKEDFTDLLKEFKRVLKPGGQIILSSMTFGWKWYHHFWSWMAKNFPDLMTDCRPVNLKPFLKEVGFKFEVMERISQNTFPTQIIKAVNL